MKILSLSSVIILLFASLFFNSCDTTNDTDYEVSRDCIISSVKLGTLKRYVPTISSTGADSVMTVSVTGTMYPMYIDQLENRIYNADSLPVGTDVSKVVFSTFNATGTVAIKSNVTGKDTIFTAKDSTDFTLPRTLTVISPDGVSKRDYTLEIRLHREMPDSFVWHKMAAGSAAATFMQSRSLTTDGRIYVFGNKADGSTHYIVTSTKTPSFDTAQPANLAFDVRSVQLFKGKFYALANRQLLTADASANWSVCPDAPSFDHLAATSTDSLYAISDGKMWASADGKDWQESKTDTPNVLPDAELCSTYIPVGKNTATETIVLTGTHKGEASVWKRDIDAKNQYSYPWMYLPQTEELGKYSFPVLQHPTLLTYDRSALLIGHQKDGKPAPFYISYDNGRTWKVSEWPHPTFEGSTTLSCTVDSDNYLWIICGKTGEVYRGRLNRLGWQEEENRFERSASRR